MVSPVCGCLMAPWRREAADYEGVLGGAVAEPASPRRPAIGTEDWRLRPDCKGESAGGSTGLGELAEDVEAHSHVGGRSCAQQVDRQIRRKRTE